MEKIKNKFFAILVVAALSTFTLNSYAQVGCGCTGPDYSLNVYGDVNGVPNTFKYSYTYKKGKDGSICLVSASVNPIINLDPSTTMIMIMIDLLQTSGAQAIAVPAGCFSFAGTAPSGPYDFDPKTGLGGQAMVNIFTPCSDGCCILRAQDIANGIAFDLPAGTQSCPSGCVAICGN